MKRFGTASAVALAFILGFAAAQCQPQAGAPGAAAKKQPITEFKGVNMGSLNDAQKQTVGDIFNEQKCTGCPGDYTLAECLALDPPNPTYLALANLAVRNVQAGRTKEQAKAALDQAMTRATRPPQAPPEDNKIYDVDIAGAHLKGPENAPITIVEFSDFQCPFCSRGKATMDQVAQQYGDKVRIAFKHFPLDFHRQAKPAAIAALAAGEQGKFWEMHDKLFDNQRALGEEDIKKYAQELGLDMAKFEEAIKRPDLAAKVDADIKQGKELGVTGTPTFFVNGKILKGAKPLQAFEAAINAALEKKAG